MNDLQRDFGRIEATQEIMKDDVKQIKADIAEIKKFVAGRNAVRDWNWKVVGTVSGISIILTQFVNYIKVAVLTSLS